MPWLSEHFHTSEFECKCGCGFGSDPSDINPILVSYLEEIRIEVGFPLKINSGCRCVDHNAAVGGTRQSVHTMGDAVDIDLQGVKKRKVMDVAVMLGVPGIGPYGTFIHLDAHDGSVKARPSCW